MNLRRPIFTSVIFLFLSFACVKSNLDNAFDPQFPLGLIVGMAVSSGSSDNGDSSSSSTPASVLCATGPTLQEYATAGTYNYSVPSDAATVEILVIGGGGGGGDLSGAGGTAGGSSSVKISGGSNFISATGGTNGSGSTGGAGGSPAGVTGTNGSAACGCHNGGTGGQLSNQQAGAGGRGGYSAVSTGAGGGGSGGTDSTTRTDLAGQNLEIIVGAKGTYDFPEDGASDGQDGYVRLMVY